jgi:hypothetical protein
MSDMLLRTMVKGFLKIGDKCTSLHGMKEVRGIKTFLLDVWIHRFLYRE